MFISEVNHCLPFSSTTIYLEKSRMVDMTIGERLNQLRLDAGLTLEQAGAIAGTTKQSMSQIEKGKTQVPGGVALEAWSRYYGVSIQWLTTGKGSKKPADKASQSVSEDENIMTQAAEYVLGQFEQWGISLRPKEDADLITGVFRILKRPNDNNVVVVTRWLAEQVTARGLGNVGERKTGSNGGSDSRADTATPRRTAKAKAR
ncbi:helix-turn-helix transcriptional regulator [Pseudoxanthomonas sp. CF125]|uniref:helix-turn-helix domain-containing protein n=1 Tax=Pseudoxanthomonas sp. CF125 TaxID=1855303 RepID=UPI000B87041B|nr:helix-turn-helix transcriptional regulator [Pseudoxanthomonas sp. CF125]